MSKNSFVYSTLTADNLYTGWVQGGGDLPRVEFQVLVKGGSNVADRRLVTPLGVVTEVTPEQRDFLEKCDAFNFHREGGYVSISNHREDPEKVVGGEGLETRDASSPLVPGDFDADAEGAKPVLRADADEAALAPAPPVTAPSHPAARPSNPRRA